MMLRTRLTATLVAVTAAGLLVAGLATYSALRSSLLDRLDAQLTDGAGPTMRLVQEGDLLPGGGGPMPPGGPGLGPDQPNPNEENPALPSGTYAGLFDQRGSELRSLSFRLGDQVPPIPALEPGVVTGAAADGRVFQVVSTDRTTAFRGVARRLPDGTIVVLALPLTEVRATLARLVLIELVVALAVLAAIALLSRWTVRRSLRPLEEIESTAGAIATGDLSQRVIDDGPDTEIGRLGGSLNTMLGQIETSMDEQRASEAALRRFLADASHELRTPLTSIRGYAELFRRGAEDDPQDTALAMRRIEQESERMGVLVDDLLFLARSGADRPIEHADVDLAKVASDAVADARAVAPDRAITITADGPVILEGDERRLRQVTANLLSNALVHTPARTHVDVAVAGGEAEVTLTVRDDGPGLAPEHAARVFDPFFRADEARERVRPDGERPAEGTGLGLAIVAAIADAHGGSVSLTTRPGEGASFTVRLPRFHREGSEAPAGHPAAEG